MTIERFINGALIAALLAFAVGGVWAFIDPKSFYDELALFPPYNEHLFHDVGAFQIGLAVVAGLALARRDGREIALWGLATAAVVHTVGHAIDNDLGGRDSDVPLLGGLAAFLLIAAVLATMSRKRSVA
jgi:hypothetical protein